MLSWLQHQSAVCTVHVSPSGQWEKSGNPSYCTSRQSIPIDHWHASFTVLFFSFFPLGPFKCARVQNPTYSNTYGLLLYALAVRSVSINNSRRASYPLFSGMDGFLNTSRTLNSLRGHSSAFSLDHSNKDVCACLPCKECRIACPLAHVAKPRKDIQ